MVISATEQPKNKEDHLVKDIQGKSGSTSWAFAIALIMFCPNIILLKTYTGAEFCSRNSSKY